MFANYTVWRKRRAALRPRSVRLHYVVAIERVPRDPSVRRDPNHCVLRWLALFVKPGRVGWLDGPFLRVRELQHHCCLECPPGQQALSLAVQDAGLPVEHRLQERPDLLLQIAHPAVVACRADRTNSDRVRGGSPLILRALTLPQMVRASTNQEDPRSRRRSCPGEPPGPDVFPGEARIPAEDAWHIHSQPDVGPGGESLAFQTCACQGVGEAATLTLRDGAALRFLPSLKKHRLALFTIVAALTPAVTAVFLKTGRGQGVPTGGSRATCGVGRWAVKTLQAGPGRRERPTAARRREPPERRAFRRDPSRVAPVSRRKTNRSASCRLAS
jgi:hypothetical protein